VTTYEVVLRFWIDDAEDDLEAESRLYYALTHSPLLSRENGIRWEEPDD
jgi:hypothetical protein